MKDKVVDIIENEARLEALRRTSLLDSPPEEAFDRLTRLATTVLCVPVALVSLVDGDRQFFKSQCGLSEPLASARQTPLTHSFCKHAVGSREPLIVTDARRDPLLGQSPAVLEDGVIAYAGIPLITSEGHALGTFCVVDRRPHQWTEEEIGILRVLAASTMSEIELRRVADELRASTVTLQSLVESRTSELRAAEERQRVLLDVNNAVVTCLDRDSLFSATAAALRRVIPFDRAAMVLYDPTKDVFKVLGVAGPVPSPPVIPLGTEWPRHQSRSRSGKGIEQSKLGMLPRQGLNLFLIVLNRRTQIAQDSYQCRRVAHAGGEHGRVSLGSGLSPLDDYGGTGRSERLPNRDQNG